MIPSSARDSRRIRGLFDFQVNGFGGIDFQRDDLTLGEFQYALKALEYHGVARIFATLITDEVNHLCHRLARMEEFCAADRNVAMMIAGYHLEGPWLSAESGFCGAHPPEWMHPPSGLEYGRLQAAAGGRIRLVTLAPEWPGSVEFIAALHASGVHVAIGHTNASESQIDEAVAAGARFCTHLGNGVPQMLPRHDNVVQRLLARDELVACFIPDGMHLPPFVLRNFVRAKPEGRVLFTTDAMAGAGAPVGAYSLGRLKIEIGQDGVARQPGGAGFAGSTLTPDEGVRHTAQILGISLVRAQHLWSEAPASAFGVKLSDENEFE